MMYNNPRKFNVGDTVRLTCKDTRCNIKNDVVKYIYTTKWGWNYFSSHYIGFDSDGYANWGECLFELVEKGTE